MTDYLMTPLAALPFPNIDPVALQVGPLTIHWYGLGYVVGILLGWWYARRLVSNERLWAGGKPAMTVTDLDDFVLWAAIGIVAGGRIGYILFYDLPRYIANPLIGYLAGDWLTMGMVLSTPMVLVGVWAMLRARAKAAPATAL